jgi:hypothetical protein
MQAFPTPKFIADPKIAKGNKTRFKPKKIKKGKPQE